MWQIQMSYINFQGFKKKSKNLRHCLLTTPILPCGLFDVAFRFIKLKLVLIIWAVFFYNLIFAMCHYKVECLFFIFYLVEINLGHLFQ
jgi:hypothetical protein